MQLPAQDVFNSQSSGRQTSEQADHAAMAMQAARRIARARRKSQKEKMGRVVCHHLLCLLNQETPRPARVNTMAMRAARSLVSGDVRQGSLGF